MEELRNKSVGFIYNIWENDYKDNSLTIGSENFEKIAEKSFLDITKDHIIQKQPILIKLGGQSGSGKTTQLFPSIKYGLEKNNIDFIHIAVRKFAEYHPYYDELLNKFGKENIREKTNGFALLLLFRVFEKLVENKYNIFFEVTLLEQEFEEYIIKLSKKYNYSINYNILAVPHLISDNWIKNREQDLYSEENKRIVLQSSSNYFYKSLPKALERIISLKDIFNEKDFVVMWNHYSKNPIFNGHIDDKILDIFSQNRENITDEKYDKDILLQKKQLFYMDFFSKLK